MPKLDQVFINEFDVSNRAFSALVRNDILSLSELVTYSEADLLRLPGLGRQSVESIKYGLAELGLELSSDEKATRRRAVNLALKDRAKRAG